jgi:hypothetical protein
MVEFSEEGLAGRGLYVARPASSTPEQSEGSNTD